MAFLRRWTIALMVWPALAGASPYDGIYKQVANADCGLVGVDGGALEIRDGVFYGVDMQCRMTRPVNVNAMDATLYTMECAGAEQSWTERALMMKPAPVEGDETPGLIMLWNGYAFVYEGCKAP